MNKLIVLVVLCLFVGTCAAVTSSCYTGSTQYGDCVGLGADKVPGLQYDLDVGNVVIAAVFSETIVIPLIILLSDAYCPVGKYPVPATPVTVQSAPVVPAVPSDVK